MSTLPYSDIFTELLTLIHRALEYCHKRYKKGELLSEDDKDLNKIFEEFSRIKTYQSSKLNEHIIKGLTLGDEKRRSRNEYPRLTKLVIYSYLQAQKIKKTERYQAEVLPSPLGILYHALTVPHEPQTAAYSFVLCRGMLFYFLKLHPHHPDLKTISPNFEPFGEEDIINSISSFNSYINIQARWPDNRTNIESFNTRINYLNGHILSVKGYTHLWFNNSAQLLDFCKVSTHSSSKDLIRIYSNNFPEEKRYFFRLSNSYTALPDASEMNNWIFGVPIPLRGADLLFYGGLKKSSTTGLVISLHGNPGSGKTSAALSLAAVLSPFQTKTLYLSLEENPADLTTRLNSLVPDYLRKLSIYEYNYHNQRKNKNKDSIELFTAFKIKEFLSVQDLTEILAELKTRVRTVSLDNESSKDDTFVPAVCPMLIVIDNVNELFNSELKDQAHTKAVGDFVEQCRDMGAFVILIAAGDIPSRSRLDYLVDVALDLKQEGIDNKYEKPVRVLQLLKTRHQVSRQGTHVFHLSNSKGFRISPQVPSQMDKREKVRIELPSREDFIHTLNLIENEKGGSKVINFLPFAANSQILVHGYGSSGKAGFGLKILLTPLLKEDILSSSNGTSDVNKLEIGNQKINKVLVISFLYPEEYYEVLHDRICKQLNSAFENYDKRKSSINVKSFYPGFLTPEDFVYKIVRKLEEARLEGEPYTGVLLDGLHNVFLQFKKMQDAHLIWPLLYSILYRYSLTVVTTFTNFSLGEQGGNESRSIPEDYMLLQQGQKPFLHGLVKAADYFITLSERSTDMKKEYLVEVRSSIRQVPPGESLLWDREALVVTGRKQPV